MVLVAYCCLIVQYEAVHVTVAHDSDTLQASVPYHHSEGQLSY